MGETIGIGLISFAHSHQKAWADVFGARPEVDVKALWDDDEERGEAESARLSVPFERRLDDLLARRDIHAVTICAENVKHANLAIRAADAGKHMMVQKPMTTTVEEAKAVVRAVRRAGVTFMQAYNLRFDPLHIKVKQLVDAGAIGRVMVARRRHSHHFGLDPDNVRTVLDWMADPKLSGGGTLMDEGAHALLWFLWMFGPPNSVSAHIITSMPHLAVDDTALLTFEFASGTVGTLQTSWTEMAAGPTIEIYGDEGVIVATGTDISSTRFMPQGTPLLQLFRQETETWEQLAVDLSLPRPAYPAHAFVDCLARRSPSPVPVDMGAMSVVMAQAAYESAETGRKVFLSR